jgi:hypothetical protein
MQKKSAGDIALVTVPNNEAIKRAGGIVPGVEVKRGEHLRIVYLED